MINDKLAKLEAKRLVKEFRKQHEKGEFRNKLGRIWWPIWNRFVIPSVCLGSILTGSVAAIAAGAALWGLLIP